MSVYDDKEVDPELLAKYANCTQEVNVHSATLVITCINKLQDFLLAYA